MSVQLVSLALSLDGPRLIGTILLRNGEDGATRQVNVRESDSLPGYELFSTNDDVLADMANAFTREANRLIQMLLLPASEVIEREAAVRSVLASGHLNVLDDALTWRTHLMAFARGEITRDQLGWLATQTARLMRQPVPITEPAPDKTLPPSWWEAMRLRVRQDEYETTAPLKRVRTMLDCNRQELAEHLDREHFLTIQVGGEERAPRWQFHPNVDERARGSHTFVPGLDIIIACTSPQSRDGRSLGAWMQAPNPHLLVNAERVTPREWLVQNRPVASVVAAIGYRK